ncbi:hypothetical protein QYE76_065836 [Lolium multiflorum]|uniref:Uncharacterized protein n=1 Tax=Lolium multiflorum TaxID=4521 RepID=A0AAD8W948_LOLMU|nr:hypothetical protein QYE76_065836 [Lolium multiflorum]
MSRSLTSTVPEGDPRTSSGRMATCLTDGEDDLRFLIDGELEAESDDTTLLPGSAHHLQRLKALLPSSIETLVENSEEVKNILEEIQPHVPVTLQLKPWPVVTLPVFRSRMQKWITSFGDVP